MKLTKWCAMCVTALASTAACAAENWTASLKNLSAGDAAVLLQLSRDLYAHKALPDSDYIRCILPVDEAAVDPKVKESWADTFKSLAVASKHMGYNSYLEFVDAEERAHIGKQAADSPWLRQYKNQLRGCLYTPEVKATLKMH
jgi:hypothetical protein